MQHNGFDIPQGRKFVNKIFRRYPCLVIPVTANLLVQLGFLASCSRSCRAARLLKTPVLLPEAVSSSCLFASSLVERLESFGRFQSDFELELVAM